MRRIIPKSKLHSVQTISDSLKHRKSMITEKAYDLPLFYEARDVYMSQEPIRKQRLRNIRYVFGDQWGDIVKNDQGEPTTERERISKRTGGVVLQNNNLFKVVNTMAGIYVKSSGQPVVYARQENADQKATMMTNALQTNYDNNEMSELMMSAVVELLCGGVPIFREDWDTVRGTEDSYTFPVDIGYFAWRSKGNDPRLLWDVDMLIEIRDNTLGEVKVEYSKSAEDDQMLDYIYAPYLNLNYPNMPDEGDHENASWDIPSGRNLCRTYHVWTQEYKFRYRCVDRADFEQPIYRIEKEDLPAVLEENRIRKEEFRKLGITDEAEMTLIEYEQIKDMYWHCTVFGPEGIIIDEYDSKYDHKEHPYVFTAHHYVNGRVYPFINVVIDQQRYINRLITLQDLYINSAIKGLKMVPKSMLGGLSPREFARRATEMGGWIFYEPDERFPTLAPQIIQTASRDIGVAELLNIQLSQIDEITTVSSAIRGSAPQSGTPASRYALETENAITSLAATYKKFNNFENAIARKKLKVIHEKYQNPRNISVWHSNGYLQYAMYDPKLVEDVDFSVVVRQAPETPVARMTNNDLFKEMWLRGILNTKQLLQYSDLPGTEQLKQDLEAMEEQQAQQGGMPQQGAPQEQAPQALSASDMGAQVTQSANGDTVSAIQQALRQDLGSLTQV